MTFLSQYVSLNRCSNERFSRFLGRSTVLDRFGTGEAGRLVSRTSFSWPSKHQIMKGFGCIADRLRRAVSNSDVDGGGPNGRVCLASLTVHFLTLLSQPLSGNILKYGVGPSSRNGPRRKLSAAEPSRSILIPGRTA